MKSNLLTRRRMVLDQQVQEPTLLVLALIVGSPRRYPPRARNPAFRRPTGAASPAPNAVFPRGLPRYWDHVVPAAALSLSARSLLDEVARAPVDSHPQTSQVRSTHVGAAWSSLRFTRSSL